MSLELYTAPTVEPVSFAEMKDHLRLPDSTEEAVVQGFIAAARELLETQTRSRFVTQTWRYWLDGFPDDTEPILLPYPPLQSVTVITYIDTNGDEQTWAAANYQVDGKSWPARILPAYGAYYPSTRDVLNAVCVRFTCGYGGDFSPAVGAANIPEAVKAAHKLLVGAWYEHREELTEADLKCLPLPVGVRALIAPYTDWRF